jgi:hypothetical protein
MENMDGWNLLLLAAAAVVAIVSLTRMMLDRRNQLMGRFRQEVENERSRRKETKPAKSPRPTNGRAA